MKDPSEIKRYALQIKPIKKTERVAMRNPALAGHPNPSGEKRDPHTSAQVAFVARRPKATTPPSNDTPAAMCIQVFRRCGERRLISPKTSKVTPKKLGIQAVMDFCTLREKETMLSSSSKKANTKDTMGMVNILYDSRCVRNRLVVTIDDEKVLSVALAADHVDHPKRWNDVRNSCILNQFGQRCHHHEARGANTTLVGSSGPI